MIAMIFNLFLLHASDASNPNNRIMYACLQWEQEDINGLRHDEGRDWNGSSRMC